MKSGTEISTKDLAILTTNSDFNFIAGKTIVFGMIPGTKTVVMTEEISKSPIVLKVLDSMEITGDIMGNGLNRNQVEAKLFKNRATAMNQWPMGRSRLF